MSRRTVTDSLQYSPEKCTVIATYKHLVVGVAILSSPQETYITYLAVRAGWENSQIATCAFHLSLPPSKLFNYLRHRSMLYHLIQLNPNKDITLHVSANNPAMVRYDASASWGFTYSIHLTVPALIQPFRIQGRRIRGWLL